MSDELQQPEAASTEANTRSRGAVEDAVERDRARFAANVAEQRRLEDERRSGPANRPNGRVLIWSGISLIAVGVIAALVAAFTPYVQSAGSAPIGDIYPGTPPILNSWKYPVLWLGNAAVGLGIVLWALGQVMRAMFFLPGRNVTVGELEA